MIVCSDKPTEISVRVSSGLKQGPVHVWHSSATDQFVNEDDVKVVDGKLSVALEGNSIYSLTTTTGQKKGRPAHEIPPARTFPLPYSEDFESYAPGVTPRYLSDQRGTFEVFDEPGHGKCLKQIVPHRGISWVGEPMTPFTVFGDQKWSDYTLKADVRITGGHVALAKRSCAWNLDHSGAWKLCLKQQTLASGKIDGFDAGRWHTMKLAFHRDKLSGYIDGKLLAEVGNRPVFRGMPYLASSYDGNMFDNVSVAPAASENNAGVAE
jgi:galactosylceramidase